MAAPEPALAERVAAIILAAGRSTRFGSPKLAAVLDGRPLIRHVLDTAIEAGLDPIVLVRGPTDALAGVDLAPARIVVNPYPEEGLSSSVRLGLAALDPEPDVGAAIILLGDQPRIATPTIRSLVDAAARSKDALLVVADYGRGGPPNPVVARRAAWRLADDLVGDRGFGPLLDKRPELVLRVPADGSNPDVDTPADLAAISNASGVSSDPRSP